MSSHEPIKPSADKQANQDKLVDEVLAGRFRIERLIARGGMGKVYRAEQMPLGRKVAIKVLSPSAMEADEADFFRERFEREAAACSRLTHANTVRIFDFGQHEDRFFIAMEYIDGRTLSRVLKKESPLSVPRTIHIAQQICSSLAEAHDQGIVHRDIKPGNILLWRQNDDENFVKVVDFGLVKDETDVRKTQATMVKGSPACIAPEQVKRLDSDGRADIYALGCVMYKCLTGRFPFEGKDPMPVMLAHITEEPPTFAEISPQLNIPRTVEWVVQTCLAKDPADRFADMRELYKALSFCRVAADKVDDDFTLELTEGVVMYPEGYTDVSVRMGASQVMSMVSAPGGISQVGPGPADQGKGGGKAIALAAVTLLLLGVGTLMFALGGSGTDEEAAPTTKEAPLAIDAIEAVPDALAAPEPEPEPEPVAEKEEPEVEAAPKPRRRTRRTSSKPKAEPTPAPAPSKPAVQEQTRSAEESSWSSDNEIRDPFAD